ncbi:MAG: ATP-binding protein [Roseomonas sp.]|jgi:hypothetical protein|nr:ATP-binding protein [Roseomonas sp.]MCA3304330.1 ATP-binding protein [Roseomonas sp.]
MQELFDALIEGGERAILAMIDGREQETVTLEFKTINDPSSGRMDRGDRKNLGKTLSAFANSQGGLQIWGVLARRGPGDEVDCARGPKPIANIERLKSDVMTLIGEILSPRHDGIIVASINSESHPGTGYLLIKVDRSERRPHMSRAPDDGRYYRRAGGATFPMEHGDLEDAFNRRRVATLELVYEWRPGLNMVSGTRTTCDTQIIVGLRNSDLVTARFPYLHLEPLAGCKYNEFGIDGNRNTGLRRGIHDRSWIQFSGGADDVVHPGGTLNVAALTVQIVRDEVRKQITLNGRSIVEEFVMFNVRYGCSNVPVRTAELKIPAADAPLDKSGFDW